MTAFSPRPQALLAILVAVVSAASAAYLDALPTLIGVVLLLAAVVYGLSNLLFALALAVVTVPFEEFLVLPVVGSLTRVSAIFLFVCYAFSLLRGRIRLRPDSVHITGVLLLLLALASGIWSSHPDLGALVTLAQLAAMAFIVSSIVQESPAAVQTILVSLGTAGVVAAVLGLTRFATTASGVMGPVRISASEAQGVEHFAAYLMPGILFFLLSTIRRHAPLALRVLLGIATIVLALAVLASGTRSAWIGIVAGLVLVVVPRLRGRQFALVAALVLAGVAVTAAVPGLTEFVERRGSIALDTGGAGRVDIWQAGTGLVRHNPVVGSGFASFDDLLGPQAILDAPFPGTDMPGLNRAPHSIYLGLVVELGAVGLALFGMWVIWLLVQLRGGGTLALATRASLVAYLIQGAYLDILNRKYFWLILGLAEGCSRLLQQAREQRGSWSSE